jgi:hypothetical protein
MIILFIFLLIFKYGLFVFITKEQLALHPNRNLFYGDCGTPQGGNVACYYYLTYLYTGTNCPIGCGDSDGPQLCFGSSVYPFQGTPYGLKNNIAHDCSYYGCDAVWDLKKYHHEGCVASWGNVGYICNGGQCDGSTVCNSVSGKWQNHPGCSPGGSCIENECWYFCNNVWSMNYEQHPGCVNSVSGGGSEYGDCYNNECQWSCGGETSNTPYFHDGCIDDGHCLSKNNCFYACNGVALNNQIDGCLINGLPTGRTCVSSDVIRTELDYSGSQYYYSFVCRYKCNSIYSTISRYHPGCNYHGDCFNEACLCHDQIIPESGGAIVDWSGSPTCSLPDCNSVCVNGVCATANDIIYCDCSDGHIGALCDKCNYTSHYRNQNLECVEYPVCGENETLTLYASGEFDNDYQCDLGLINDCILNDKVIIDLVKYDAERNSLYFSYYPGNPSIVCNDGVCYSTNSTYGICHDSTYGANEDLFGDYKSLNYEGYYFNYTFECNRSTTAECCYFNLTYLDCYSLTCDQQVYYVNYFNASCETEEEIVQNCTLDCGVYQRCALVEYSVGVFTEECVCEDGYYKYDNVTCKEIYYCDGISQFDYSNVCGGNGNCIFHDNCQCHTGYYLFLGECKIITCNGISWNDPNVCSDHGKCVKSSECDNCLDVINNCQLKAIECIAIPINDCSDCEPTFQSCISGCEEYFNYTIDCTGSSPCCFEELSLSDCSDQNDTCDCTIGWTGSNCEIPTCQNKLSTDSSVCNYQNGTCTSPDNCECNDGWQGDECEIVDCDNLCNNHQTCVFNGIEVLCICEDGWSGATCQIPVCDEDCNSTYHKTCYYPNQCICENDYYLYNDTCIPVCTTCDQTVGICTGPHTCECPESGFDDTNGDGSLCTPICAPECNETEQCVYNGESNECVCKYGYTLNNETEICETNCTGGCNLGEQCVVELISGELIASCECADGYFLDNGTLGEYGYCKPGCFPYECCDNSYCCYPDLCCCKDGYYRDVGTLLCVPDCSTLYNNTGCPLHYQCSTPDTCICEDSWSGDNCEIPVCNPKCAQGHEYCNTNLECVCVEEFWTGTNCTTPVCDPECNSTNHKICLLPGYCGCEDGYYMNKNNECIFIYICSGIESYEDAVCNYHGDCVGDDECKCDTGYKNVSGICQIKQCNSKAWNDITVCSSSGTCDIETETCFCSDGYGGIDCEYPECYGFISIDNQTCNGHGVCDLPNYCNCTDDWQGDQCQTPLCDPSCNDHQTCIYLNGTVQCICEPHWGGQFCNVSICLPECDEPSEKCIYPNTCICNQELGYYYNRNTDKCETVDWCYGYLEWDDENVCSGHGDCIANNTCKCEQYYNGDQCDNYLGKFFFNFFLIFF